MNEDNNSVKEYLFEHIKKSDVRYQQLCSQEKIIEIINDILENCYQKVSLMKDKEKRLGVLATGILHYILTNVMIPSQRKVVHRGVEIDIVIPDLKTLEKDPKKTLLVYIASTLDKNKIETKLTQLQTIQPEKQNIWIVLTKDLDFDKTYVIKKENSSFSEIIYDIGKFVNLQSQNKFKILRI
jgi:hypothetical protein